MTKSIAKKRTTGSLPPAVPLAITPTFSPWTHTSDNSYIYQLSLVLATATVSSYTEYDGPGAGPGVYQYVMYVLKPINRPGTCDIEKTVVGRRQGYVG